MSREAFFLQNFQMIHIDADHIFLFCQFHNKSKKIETLSQVEKANFFLVIQLVREAFKLIVKNIYNHVILYFETLIHA